MVAAPSPAGNDSESWRLFVALELPSAVRERVARAGEMLAAAGWRARWVRPEAAHLTLKFYGDVHLDRLRQLEDSLERAAAAGAPFTLRQTGAGAFPNLRQPRVVWLGVSGAMPALKGLVEAIERESQAAGFPRDTRAFQPHLTVGRLRPEDGGTIRDSDRLLSRVRDLPPLAIPVERVALMRSELRREGAHYTVVRHFLLDRTEALG